MCRQSSDTLKSGAFLCYTATCFFLLLLNPSFTLSTSSFALLRITIHLKMAQADVSKIQEAVAMLAKQIPLLTNSAAISAPAETDQEALIETLNDNTEKSLTL